MNYSEYDLECIAKVEFLLERSIKIQGVAILSEEEKCDNDIINGIKLLHYELWNLILHKNSYSIIYVKNRYFIDKKYKIISSCYLCVLYECRDCPLQIHGYGECHSKSLYGCVDNENYYVRMAARKIIRDIFKEEDKWLKYL